MAVLRPHLALTVIDVERSIPFYEALFGAPATDDALATKLRLTKAGLASFDEMDTTCCYARQDKNWVHDPDGTPWEVFVTHGDGDEAGESSQPCCT
jgi:predicted enzyme related to lactoylglutathione lyase